MSCQTLAKRDGVGQIVICPSCTDVHMAVDNITVRITQEAFVALGEMIQEALRHPKLGLAQNNPKEFRANQVFSRAQYN